MLKIATSQDRFRAFKLCVKCAITSKSVCSINNKQRYFCETFSTSASSPVTSLKFFLPENCLKISIGHNFILFTGGNVRCGKKYWHKNHLCTLVDLVTFWKKKILCGDKKLWCVFFFYRRNNKTWTLSCSYAVSSAEGLTTIIVGCWMQ